MGNLLGALLLSAMVDGANMIDDEAFAKLLAITVRLRCHDDTTAWLLKVCIRGACVLDGQSPNLCRR